ncbi:MAG: P-loop ATPase, Sll1717 family [Egibacteraceae bacterium]
MPRPIARQRSTAKSGLDLGAPAAERDIKKGLADCFIESDAFDRVQRGDKLVVVGNRGVGKSAIFQVLAQRERANGTFVIELTPEDYSYQFLSRAMLPERSGSWAKMGAYAVAWKYVIYVLVMQELTQKGARKKEAAAIYRFVRDHCVGGATSKLSTLVSYLKRMEEIKIGNYGASLRVRELEKLYKLAEIEPLLPSLCSILEDQRVVVLVDELDRGWDESEDAKAFVAGLFQACMSINRLSDNLSVYISLRQELYDNIPALYEDAQKYRDVIEVISWTKPRLLQLAAARIRYALGGLELQTDQCCWERVFGKRSPQSRVSSFDYVVDRTLYRPREIIQLAAHILDSAFDRRTGIPVDAAIIAGVEPFYSEERARDIAAEYRFQHPGLLSLFEAFRGSSGYFDYEDLVLSCLEIATETVLSGEASGWVRDQDPELMMEILWRVGFLQAQMAGKNGAQPAEAFLGHHQVSHLNLRAAQRFRIHPMFWGYLDLARTTDPRSR